MPVIAMTREMGSLGKDVAMGLAEEFNLKLIQHELVEHVADKLNLKESAVNRFLEGKAGLLERWGIDKNELSVYTKEEMLDIAESGNVLIRGWGASYILRTIPHVLCVRVCAPKGFRIGVMKKRLGIDDDVIAAKEIEKSDAAHTKTMQHLFQCDYTDPLLYDIVLNSERVSIKACIDTIKGLLSSAEFQASDESRSKLADLHLKTRIEAALKSSHDVQYTNQSIDVSLEAGTGVVTLEGIVYDRQTRQAAESTVSGVTGVTKVVNRISEIRYDHMGP